MERTDVASDDDPGLPERLAETLRQRGALAGLPADAVAGAVLLGALVELEPGEALIREGDAATPEIFLLLEGTLVVQSQNGTLARLDHVGDVVGETAVVLSSRRTADVVAESAARVLSIPSSILTLPEFGEVAAGIRSAMLRDDWVEY